MDAVILPSASFREPERTFRSFSSCLLPSSFARSCPRVGGHGGRRSSTTCSISGAVLLTLMTTNREKHLLEVNNRKPYHSINFVIAHDGLTLYDLVSYNSKHNEANGEGGLDGSNDNFSWNCGCEGETKDPSINSLRSRQMKNFHLALMVSQGTPMILMGDEYGHTRYGNNNSYGHDTLMNHFQWDKLESRKDSHFRFFSEVIKFRRNHHLLGCENFLTKNDVTWHEGNWDNHDSKFLAFTLHGPDTGGDMYVAFNAHHYFVTAVIPSAPRKRKWFRVVDTNLPAPDDFVRDGVPGITTTYNVAPYSSILLIAKS